jgi:hypothetical protein
MIPADTSGRYGFNALLLALLIAAAVRVLPVGFNQPSGRDIVEYESVARNLHLGLGYRLDLKIYRAADTPVVHYSGYDRAPLFPLTLALLHYAASEEMASRLIGPLLFLLMLVLVYDLVRKLSTVSAAFWTTTLIGVHPGLLALSLQPLTETQVLLFVVLALWALFRLEYPWVAGFAAALAFLTRPSSAVAFLAIGLACLTPPIRRRAPWGIVGFVLIALAGPALLVWLNRTYEAPLFLLPQSFLLRVLDHTHASHLMHAGEIHPIPWAMLGGNFPSVAYRVAKHALYYVQYLAGATQGLGAIVLLAPLSLWGFHSRGLLPVAVVALGVGLFDLAFYTLVPSTFDAPRFTSVFLLTASLVILAGLGLAFQSFRDYSRDERWRRVPAFTGLALLLFWGASDAFSGYIEWREQLRGGPYRHRIEALWNRPDSLVWADAVRPAGIVPRNGHAVLTNVPWFVHRVTHMPASLLPWDVTREDVLALIQRDRPTSVIVHAADWPAAHAAGMEAVREVMKELHAERVFRSGAIEHWRLEQTPSSPAPPPTPDPSSMPDPSSTPEP